MKRDANGLAGLHGKLATKYPWICGNVFTVLAMKTSAAGGRHQQPRRTHRDKRRHDNEDDDDDDDDKSQDSVDSPTSPRSLSRDEVLAALGYRSAGNTPQSASAHLPQTRAQRRTACRRCAKTVYPLELIDIGDSYHRGCFKCYVSALYSRYICVYTQ